MTSVLSLMNSLEISRLYVETLSKDFAFYNSLNLGNLLPFSFMMCLMNFHCLVAGELVKNVASVVLKWSKLLKYYLASIDDEVGI